MELCFWPLKCVGVEDLMGSYVQTIGEGIMSLVSTLVVDISNDILIESCALLSMNREP